MAVAVEDKVKALTPADPEIALRDAQERLRVIKESNRRLRYFLSHSYELVCDRLASMETFTVVSQGSLRSFTCRPQAPT